MQTSKSQYWFIFFLLLTVLVCIALLVITLIPKKKDVLTVAFLDIGQGDSIYIETPSNVQVLVDAGPADGAVLRELPKVMGFFDRSIDMIVPTHGDADHIGGFPDIFLRYAVGSVLLTEVENETALYDEFVRMSERENADTLIARRGQIFELGDEIYLSILFPDRDLTGVDPNDASIVARLDMGDTCFLLTGDMPSKIEKYLVDLDPEILDCDVLKAGHHGSRTSSSEEFVRAVSPDYTVISAGQSNTYGHPHAEVLETLRAWGGVILGTYEEGTIVFETDGRELKVLR